MSNERNKRIVSVLMTLTIIFTLMGGTLSYLRWQTTEEQKTLVTFTIESEFSCAADGGGDIASSTLMPATCTNPTYAIQREVIVTPTIKKDDLSIYMDLWLDINELGSGLSQSEYFKYALTTEENSCTTGIVSEGRFTGLSAEKKDKVMLLNEQEYTSSEPQTYYLYIWIDPLEENNYIVDQSFNFTLGGSCSDITKGKADAIEYIQNLKNQHEFIYYETLSQAVTDVNNSVIGTNSTPDETAAVAVYTENNHPNVILLKDTTEETRIEPSVDMTINLGGNTFTSTNTRAFSIATGNVTIDGSLKGSTIKVSHEDGQMARAILIPSNSTSNVTINGGTYIGNSTGFGIGSNSATSVIHVNTGGSLSINNATVIAAETSGATAGIYIGANAEAKITDCDILATSSEGKSKGIWVYQNGETTITNCDILATSSEGISTGIYMSNQSTATVNSSNIKAYADLVLGETVATIYSYGIDNYQGTLTINNSYVMGTHSGIMNVGTTSNGKLFLNGGIYEGSKIAGIYFTGTSSAYVRNATLRNCDMPDGYTDTSDFEDGFGFVIGGNNNAVNNLVYIDNCDIVGRINSFSLMTTYGEQNNSVYISNSRIDTSKQILIGNDTHRLYIGTGNNFTAEHTNRPDLVTLTDEVYIREE